VGSLTDGDFRRWLVDTSEPSLLAPSGDVANRDCRWLAKEQLGVSYGEVFAAGIEAVPVLDEQGHVIAIAHPRTRDFVLGDNLIADGSPSFLIAEIGINHNGNLDTALHLMDAALDAGANCAKLQLRDVETLYRTDTSGDGEDLGAQYTLELIKETQLSIEDTLRALDHARNIGLVPLCTPWDVKSAEVLDEYGIPAFKVASADLTNHPLLEFLSQTGRPLLVSTGMSTEEEIGESVAVLQQGLSNYALLQCSSAYPAPYKDLNLAYMSRLEELGDCHVGYSGHERGHHVAVAAVALGAKIIEKHITLDRSARGNDHRVSLEPDQFKHMVNQVRDVEMAIGTAKPRRVTQGESLNRLALSKSLVAASNLPAGHVIERGDVAVKSPGRGLQPNSLGSLIGATLQRPVEMGDFFFPSDLQDSIGTAREYSFGRPWGLPVRFHDWRELAEKSNPDFLEFHLSYRDLELDFAESLDEEMLFGLVVHSPDLFANDLILDLAALEADIFERSVAELQRVIDLTRELTPRFRLDAPPIVVASLGGSSLEAPVSSHLKHAMYEQVIRALGILDLSDVQLIAQTLPPFPWYLGGQRHCNLFVDPDELVDFSQSSGIKLCFDVAHTKLATNHERASFIEAAAKILPHSTHLHLVDAGGSDNEGLQILEGEIDWQVLTRQIVDLAPSASFIPEIWQGHVDGGRGFWIALDRLEGLL
jgi:N-acetylneuraminate synthase